MLKPVLGILLLATSVASALGAQNPPQLPCERPEPGAVVQDSRDLRSENGVLAADLTLKSDYVSKPGRYCYIGPDGSSSPTLRVHPGDLLILHLKNELTNQPESST